MAKLQPPHEVDVPQSVEIKKSSEENDLDAIIVQIGQFGRFQIRNYILLCLPIICNAFYSISYVFTASQVEHRCNISACDTFNSSFEAPWLNFTTPAQASGQWLQCQHFANAMEPVNAASCNASQFDKTNLVNCEAGYKVKDDELTIANEFGIFCKDQWQLTMVGTVNNIGQFVGIPLGGYLADRYGRKTLIVASGVLSSFAGLSRSLAPNYYSFLFFEFLDMTVGSTLFPTAFLLAVELVGPQRRVYVATAISLTYGLTEAALGYLAQYIPDWRILLRVIYTPALLHLLFICLLPESVRWLLSQSRENEARQILSKVASVNGRELPDKQLSELMRNNRQVVAQIAAAGGHYSMRQIVAALGWRIALCCVVWFTHTLICLGLSLNASALSGSKYENFSMTGFMQLPGILLGTLIMDRIGRRWALFLALSSCGVSLLGSAALSEVYAVASAVLYFVAKMLITGSFMILYFFTSEIFPTNCRNSLLSFCSMVGRFGSMLAPQMPLLANYFKYAPHLLFSAVGFLCAILVLLLPETTNKVLPTTLEEAQVLDKSMPKKPKNVI